MTDAPAFTRDYNVIDCESTGFTEPAELFEVSYAAIQAVQKNRTWKHVPPIAVEQAEAEIQRVREERVRAAQGRML